MPHHQLHRRLRRDALDERLEQRLRDVVPTTYSVSLGSRPIMSMFRSMTMDASVHRRRWRQRRATPRSPDSSPSKAAKISEFAGLCALKYFASANSAAVPDALSSAPLNTWPFRMPM